MKMRTSRRVHRTARRLSLVIAAAMLAPLAPNPATAAAPFGGENVIIGLNSAQNETTIAIDPSNVRTLIGGANDYRGTNGTQCGAYRSTDRGRTWTNQLLPLVAGFGESGDPIVEFNGDGSRAYYLCMMFNRDGSGNGIQHTQYVYTSTDGGQNWGAPVVAIGTAMANRDDKGALGVDVAAGSPNLGNVYASNTRLNTREIRFARSTNNGGAFGADFAVNDGSPAGGFVQGSSITAGADGDVYVAWADCCTGGQARILIDKSTDGGQNFGAFTGGTDVLVRSFAPIGNPGGPGVRPLPRVNSFPVIAAHPTVADTLFAVWAEDPAGTDDSDIMFARSTDGGQNWSAPIRLNDDVNPSGEFFSQFFPWMSVDPITNDIDIVWYSDQNDANRTDGAELVDLYFTRSANGGASFGASIRVTDQSSRTDGSFASPFFGDYNGIDSRGGVAHPLWTDDRAGNQEAATTQIGGADLSITKSDAPDPATAGETLDYTINVNNAGPADAFDVEVTDTLPAQVTYQSGPPECSHSAGTVTCTRDVLQSGASWNFTITVLVDPSAGGSTLTNNVSVDSDQDDPNAANNSASTTTAVVAVSDFEMVSVVADGPPSELIVGETATFDVDSTIRNNGPSGPTDATVTRTATPSAGATVAPAGAVSNEAAVDVGESRTVTDAYTVGCTAPGNHTVTFISTVESTDPAVSDPDPSNDSDQTVVAFECLMPVQINIKPGSTTNPVNVNANGSIPVAILTTAAGEYGLPLAFNALTIDVDSIRFGPESLVASGGGAPESHGIGHPEDALEMDETTRDGDVDLLTHFATQLTGIAAGDTEACVRGTFTTLDGTFGFVGCDVIST